MCDLKLLPRGQGENDRVRPWISDSDLHRSRRNRSRDFFCLVLSTAFYIFFFFFIAWSVTLEMERYCVLNPRAISFTTTYVHSMSVGVPLRIISTIHRRLQSFMNLGKSGRMNYRWYDFYINGWVRERERGGRKINEKKDKKRNEK